MIRPSAITVTYSALPAIRPILFFRRRPAPGAAFLIWVMRERAERRLPRLVWLLLLTQSHTGEPLVIPPAALSLGRRTP